MGSSRRDYLELRASMGALTDAERAELERLRADRSIAYTVNGGSIIVHALRPYTTEEWKEIVAKSRGQTGPLLSPEVPKSE